MPQSVKEGMDRDALMRGLRVPLEQLGDGVTVKDLEREGVAVQAEMAQHLKWIKEDVSHLFRKDYNAINLRGA